MDYSYNERNLNKHKVSYTDLNEVLSMTNKTTTQFEMSLARNGNLREMFVGFNHAGRLIEIGVEFIAQDSAYVFHAQSVSPRYRKLYEKRIASQ